MHIGKKRLSRLVRRGCFNGRPMDVDRRFAFEARPQHPERESSASAEEVDKGWGRTRVA